VDKIIPTPINFNRVGIILSSNVDSYCFRIIRIFNIINFYFRDRCGAKLATLHCNIGSIASGPGLSSDGSPTSRHPLLLLVAGKRARSQ
jgi:hypothetical protein